MIQPVRIVSTHEDLFVDRYQHLRAWSMQLAGNHKDLADDLLHDAFVQFTFARPDLSEIHNLDGYLYRMLRNLHVSQIRREVRNRLQQLSVIEYDSALDSLSTTDLRDRCQAEEELRRVCRYACARKETSSVASVLILRFFLGYYPSEIARVSCASRSAVDVQLLVARREARAVLENPQKLGFIADHQVPSQSRGPIDLVDELRLRIFQSKHSACSSLAQLRDLYAGAGGGRMDCMHLAHLVSCFACLDEVNRILGLPLLAQRNPTETLGRDSRPNSRGPSGNGPTGGSGVFSSWLQRARRVFEHKPQELCVAVNGYVQASQTIHSELSELNLNIDLAEDISFVEVFSEQKLRLLLLSIDELPPLGPGKCSHIVEMSNGRMLKIDLEFRSPWPALKVFYKDPTFKEVQELLEEADKLGERAWLAPVNLEKSSGEEVPPATFVAALSEERPKLLSGLMRRLFAADVWLRPGTVTVLFALILIGGFLLTRYSVRRPVPIANELLARAAAAEDSIASRPDAVIHRTINFEERVLSTAGEAELPVTRRRIEIWQSAEKGITARRLYDSTGALLAGDWRRADGLQALYHHGSHAQSRVRNPQSAIRNLDDVWQFSPSAKDFSLLLGANDVTQVEDRGGVYILSAESAKSAKTADVGVIKVSLTLSKSDLHATELIAVIASTDARQDRQSADRVSQLKVYRFVETSFERRPPSAVAPAVFEPEPELLGEPAGDARTRRHGDEVNSAPPRAPVVASAALEVEVLSLISQSGADLGDQVSVRRSAEGQLLVEGIVETERQKEEVLRTLTALARQPSLKLKVETVDEVLKDKARRDVAGNVSVERLESSGKAIPADAVLRQYLSAKGLSGVQLDKAVSQFADRMVSRSLTSLRHAGALDRLAQRFSLEDLRALDPDARQKWLRLLTAHAASVDRELTEMRNDLSPFLSLSTTDVSVGSIFTDSELQQSAHRLFQLISTIDEAVRGTFAVSSSGAKGLDVRSSQFLQSFKSAQVLTQRVQAAR
jgi:RNA polymerase sigma factor (sigma-70 family)